jgi:uncharacterized protein YbdZ (MbtH family)
MPKDDEDKRSYKVVVNHEEQYSLWFADRENAPGWRDAGKTGSKAECLAFIEEVWTDMRPRSLRVEMEERALRPSAEPPPGAPVPRHPGGVNGLVQRLQEAQEVEASVLPRPEPKLLKEALDRGFVFVTFLRTGTRVGVTLDRAACDLTGADFDAGSGVIALAGDLTLNYNRVRYFGDLDLRTLRGTGRLEFVKSVAPGEGTQNM